MDQAEAIIRNHLEAMGFTDIEHEPDGNIPPDFLVNGEIAVEVRRLNQHYNYDKNQPLEKRAKPLIDKIQKMLREDFNDIKLDHSAYVFVYFYRPLSKKNVDKQLKEIKKILQEHIPFINERRSCQICDNLEIELSPASKKLNSAYVLGAYVDRDSWGFTVSTLCENLKIVIEEKTKKIAPHRCKYQVWWLALVDYIGHGGVSKREIEQLLKLPDLDHPFDKILLVSPGNPEHAHEI